MRGTVVEFFQDRGVIESDAEDVNGAVIVRFLEGRFANLVVPIKLKNLIIVPRAADPDEFLDP